MDKQGQPGLKYKFHEKSKSNKNNQKLKQNNTKKDKAKCKLFPGKYNRKEIKDI